MNDNCDNLCAKLGGYKKPLITPERFFENLRNYIILEVIHIDI